MFEKVDDALGIKDVNSSLFFVYIIKY